MITGRDVWVTLFLRVEGSVSELDRGIMLYVRGGDRFKSTIENLVTLSSAGCRLLLSLFSWKFCFL